MKNDDQDDDVNAIVIFFFFVFFYNSFSLLIGLIFVIERLKLIVLEFVRKGCEEIKQIPS